MTQVRSQRCAEPEPATSSVTNVSSSIPRRILMTADTVGGVWTYALELAEALEPFGVQVALATMGAPLSDAQHRAASALTNVQIYESAYKLEWMDDPWEHVDRAGRWLQEVARDSRPDVVHVNGYSHAALDFGAPVLVVAHSCVLSWWRAVKRCHAPATWDIYRRRVVAGLEAANTVAAPTRAMLEEVRALYRASFYGCVIPNGRGCNRFAPRPKCRFAFTAGRLWDEAKNVSAVDACARDLPWPIYVAGPRRLPGGGEVRTRHARHLGSLEPQQLAEWLASAAVFVLPARYEPFGLSALEAALSGCALVLGDIPSLREVWGDAAWFVPPDDVDEIRDAVHTLMNDTPGRVQLANRALRRASELSPASMASQYVSTYAAILDGQAHCASAGR